MSATLRRGARDAECPPGCTNVHSYTSDDVRWCWAGADASTSAIDVELRVDPPPHLARKLSGSQDFWRAWTSLEVVAKLTQTPVLVLLDAGKLGTPPPPTIELFYRDCEDACICLGTRRTA